MRTLIEIEKSRPESPFSQYFFGDDRAATLFRSNISGINQLVAISSKMVEPLVKGKDWKDCIQHNRTVRIKNSGQIVHKFTTNLVPDKHYGKDHSKLGYMEDYFLDEQSQLEKRIAVGDSTFLQHLKDEDKEIMKNIVKDIQTQLLTHNGFVKTIRDHRNKIQNELQTQLTQVEKDFDEKYLTQFRQDSDEEFEDGVIEDYDEDEEKKSLNPLIPIKMDEDQKKEFRRIMKEKKKFLEEKRQEIREDLIVNRSLCIQMPYKNPTTIQERTFNDPRSGVVCVFVPNDQPNRPRAAFYKCSNDTYKLQVIDERNAEYDLMAYPVFYPEGTALKLGWTDNVQRVLKKEELIEGHYNSIKHKLPSKRRSRTNTLKKKVKAIQQVWGLKNLTIDDFDYSQLHDRRSHTLSIRQWYNFMLYERAGRLKKNVMEPKKELYEFRVSSNMKLKKLNQKSRMVKTQTDEEVYKKSIKVGKEKYKIKVHPKSRIQYILTKDGSMKPIDNPLDGDETALRDKKKKNPILYGGRLKLYWLCDQGLKRDNNSLRWEQTPQMQKQRRRMRFRNLKKMYNENQPVDEEGEPVVLGANYKKSKRWYDQQYQDSIAVALKYENCDLFITVTGRSNIEEIRRLTDGRKLTNLPELTNRFFNVKLKSILHDIVKKQVFGRIVGKVWIIEYQKRYIFV